MKYAKFGLIGAMGLVLAGCAEPTPNYGGSNYYQRSPAAYGQPTYNRPANNAAMRTIAGAGAGALIAKATGGSTTKGALIGAVAGGASCQATGNCY